MERQASTPEPNYADTELPIREFILGLRRWWWIGLAVFVAVVGAALYISSRATDVYEARTKLLIVPRVSERLLAQPANAAEGTQGSVASGPSLSVETLSSLATADDLVQKIIVDLDLRDAAGQLVGPESLVGMLRPKVETAGRGGSQASLPLLTMAVRGGDPKLVKRVADAWAAAFVRQNAELFSTEAVRSYDFLASQAQEAQQALRAKQDERLAYTRANPLTQMQTQLDIATAQYKDTLSRLRTNQSTLADTQIQLAYSESAQVKLRQLRSDRLAFLAANPVDVLQTELNVRQAQYQDYLTTLSQRQAALVTTTTRVQSLQAALAQEPRVLTLKRSVPNDVLLSSLAAGTSSDKVKALGDLYVADEEVNPTYVSLRSDLIQAQTTADTYTTEIRDLQARIVESRAAIESLKTRVGDINRRLLELDEDTAIAAYGWGGSLTTELAAGRSTDTRLVQTNKDLEARAQQLDATIQSLADKIAQSNVTIQQMDRDIAALSDSTNQLASSAQTARIAKEEQAGSIRVVESAVEPRVPIPQNKRQRLLLAALLGIVLGVGATIAAEYIAGPRTGKTIGPKAAANMPQA